MHDRSEASERFKTPSTFKIFFLLTFFGFAIRLYGFLNIEGISTDSIWYIKLAREFANGNYTAMLRDVEIPPLYPSLTGLFSFALGDFETSGMAVSSLFGALTVPLAFFLGRTVYGEKAGMVAAFFAAVHHLLVRYSAEVLTEALFYPLVLAVTIAGIKAVEGKSYRWMFLCGVFATLANLTRPTGVVILAAVLLSMLFLRNFHLRERAGLFLTGLMVFLLSSLPYLVFLYGETGVVPFTGSGRATMTGVAGWMEEGLSLRESYFDFVKEFFDAMTFPLFFLFCLGIVKRGKEGFKNSEFIALTVLTVFLAVHLAILPGKRYFTQVVPVALSFSARGFLYAREWLKERFGGKGTVVASGFLAVFALAGIWNGVELQGRRVVNKIAGEYIKENFGSGYAIITYKPIIAYYAGGRSVSFPYDPQLQKGAYRPQHKKMTLREFNEYAGKNGAAFLAGNPGRLAGFIVDFKEGDLEKVESFDCGDVKGYLDYYTLRIWECGYDERYGVSIYRLPQRKN